MATVEVPTAPEKYTDLKPSVGNGSRLTLRYLIVCASHNFFKFIPSIPLEEQSNIFKFPGLSYFLTITL